MRELKRKIWLIIVMIVSVAGLGYAGFFLFLHGGTDSLTVSEVKSRAVSSTQQLMVEGRVAPGSIDWDGKAQIMRFVLTDDVETLRVVYQGIVPDDFKPGADLIAEGNYRSDDVFEAFSFGSRRSFCTACH